HYSAFSQLLCLLLFVFFFYGPVDHRDLHSFPTRRSSDLWSRTRMGASVSPCAVSACSVISVTCLSVAGMPSFRFNAATGCRVPRDRKSTRLNSSHVKISYAVFCLKKKKKKDTQYNSTAVT